MGWTGYRPTYYKSNGQVDRKAECDAYFMGDCNKGYYNVKKSAMVGSTYYAAVEKVYEKVDGKDVYIPENERTTWAAIFLTSVENGEFFYKDMGETSGPYDCDCPKGILKLLSPTDNEWALAWRENCLKKHEEKKNDWLKSLPIGSKIIFTDPSGKEHLLVKHAPAYKFKSWFWYDSSTGNYCKKSRVTKNNSRLVESN